MRGLIRQGSRAQDLGCDAGGSIMNESITKAAGEATLTVELSSCRTKPTGSRSRIP